MSSSWYKDASEEEHWTGNSCPNCRRRTLIQATHVDQCDACGYAQGYHDYATS